MFDIRMIVNLRLINGDLCGLVGFMVHEHQFMYRVYTIEQTHKLFKIDQHGNNIVIDQLKKYCPELPQLQYVSCRIINVFHQEFHKALKQIMEKTTDYQNRFLEDY